MENNVVIVWVAYALPLQQWVEEIHVPLGSTVREVIGACETLPHLDLAQHKVGIFGKVVGLEHVVKARDRVEIYRGLVVDPMTARRLRAEKKGKL